MTVTKSLRLPNAKWCPVDYRAEAGKFEFPPLGWILHTQAGYGPLYDFFNNLDAPGRKFSHAWVGTDGKSEQYCELDTKSWANSASGNGAYWSIETEGKIGELLTPPQLETLSLWHNFLGVEDRLAYKNGEKGIGTHGMLVATACPGPARASQRSVIINLQKPLKLPPVRYAALPNAPAFPYSPLHYFGVIDDDAHCHSGTYSATDRKWIRNFQDKMLTRGWKAMDVDGIFGPETKSIIRAFQKEKHLVTSGRVGTQTWRAIWEKPL